MSADKFESLHDLFQIRMQSIYDAEQQLTETLPRMAQAASTSHLRRSFEAHLRETHTHIQRLDRAFAKLGVIQKSGRTNPVIQAMTREVERIIENAQSSALRDAALIAAGNQVEHYEIGSYGALRAFAELLEYRDIAALLQSTLEEEKQEDRRLTEIGAGEVNRKAAEVERHMAAGVGGISGDW
jgi:ferritin-like metal-binding protein YciE